MATAELAPPRRQSLRQKLRREGNAKDARHCDSTHDTRSQVEETAVPVSQAGCMTGSAGLTETAKLARDKVAEAGNAGLTETTKQARDKVAEAGNAGLTETTKLARDKVAEAGNADITETTTQARDKVAEAGNAGLTETTTQARDKAGSVGLAETMKQARDKVEEAGSAGLTETMKQARDKVADVGSADITETTTQARDRVPDVGSADITETTTQARDKASDVGSTDLTGATTQAHDKASDVGSADLTETTTQARDKASDVGSADLTGATTQAHDKASDVGSADLTGATTQAHDKASDVGSADLSGATTQAHAKVAEARSARPLGGRLPEGTQQQTPAKSAESETPHKKPHNKKCICEHCGLQLSSKARYNVHVRRHTGSTPFRCGYAGCGKRFHDNLLCKRHLRWHRNERSHFCEQCGKGYFYKHNLQEHMHVHTNLRPFSCDRCGKTFASERVRGQHAATHSLEKPYRCERCPSEFSAGFALNAHVRTQHTNQTLCSCPTCGKTFRHRSNLNRHIRWHEKDRPHRCGRCDKAYYFPSELAAHMRSHGREKNAEGLDGAGGDSGVRNSDADTSRDKLSKRETPPPQGDGGGGMTKKCKSAVKNYPCSQCLYSFPGPAALRNHVRAVHEGQKPFSCGVCGKSFTMVGSLNVHMLRHEGKRRFKCDSCEKSFFRKTDLTKHLLLHRPKQFVCKDCGASFRHKQALDVHGRIHSGVRPYACSQCQQTFIDGSTYRGHLITHTDAKDHVCSTCGKAYKYSKTLKQHMRAHTSAVAHPFSRLVRKSNVDVVVTNSDATVVGISDAGKASGVLKLAVRTRNSLPGGNLARLASGDHVKFTSASKPSVKTAEASRGSPTLNSSSLCSQGTMSLSDADLKSSVVSVFDPTKSNSPVFSVKIGPQTSIPLADLRARSVNVDSAKSSLLSTLQEVGSVDADSKNENDSIVPTNSRHVLSVNSDSRNNLHSSNSQVFSVNVVDSQRNLPPPSTQALNVNVDSQSQPSSSQVLNVNVDSQNNPFPSNSHGSRPSIIPDSQNHPHCEPSNSHQTFHVIHDSQPQMQSAPQPTVHSSLKTQNAFQSFPGQDGVVAASCDPSKGVSAVPEWNAIDLGEQSRNPRSSLFELSAAATQILGQSLESDTHIIIIEES